MNFLAEVTKIQLTSRYYTFFSCRRLLTFFVGLLRSFWTSVWKTSLSAVSTFRLPKTSHSWGSATISTFLRDQVLVIIIFLNIICICINFWFCMIEFRHFGEDFVFANGFMSSEKDLLLWILLSDESFSFLRFDWFWCVYLTLDFLK